MSDNLEEEIEQFKEHLINEYRENGGKKDLTDFTLKQIQNEIDNIKRINSLKKQIADLKKENVTPKNFKFSAVNQGRENATLAKQVALGIRGTVDYMAPPFDEREIFDERFKRDNVMNKIAPEGEEGSVVILRDEDGRMA
jgi:hypothetical protein